jgi:3-hydroxyacyl-[acyl-carrier-protein] dehydratase
MAATVAFGMDEILAVLPHRPPFLFVDCVLSLDPFKRIVAERTLRADEPHFAGHFPERAIMPGVLITDALAQTSGLLIGLSQQGASARPAAMLFFLGAANMKYPAPAFPGEVLRLSAMADGAAGRLSRFAVEARVGRKLVASGTLTLASIEDVA